jgi:hypothetical protein
MDYSPIIAIQKGKVPKTPIEKPKKKRRIHAKIFGSK